MKLKREDIITILSNIPFERNEYWIAMGGALVLHGIKKETSDIDLGCSVKLFNVLLTMGYSSALSRSGKPRIDYGEYCHFYLEWNTDFVWLDGFKVANIQSIINDKKMFGRKKDLEDISLILEFLEDNNVTSN